MKCAFRTAVWCDRKKKEDCKACYLNERPKKYVDRDALPQVHSTKRVKSFCNRCDRKTYHKRVGNAYICEVCSGHYGF